MKYYIPSKLSKFIDDNLGYHVLYLIGIVFTLCFKLHSFLLIFGFILITIVTVIDLHHITKKINLTKLYNILVFFGLYYIAEFFSRNVVYIVVDNVPDSYSYAINILNIIHIISILIFLYHSL
ncbi:hypothetical protein [Campylobacter lari]|uniref:hypothetical protein n=1 Tax=Campylobacter lari TaxID=201 RepID=UPI002149C0F0|nr:hypothetical protein [Campylobacter lari]MCR2075722.1 hypothetical protein [Campylobacter lari subsp. concheus]MCR2083298.1 hypothetical protein [Campylobacter lari subsp. concheus]MCR2084733.1 hypothetical protein [Campylobacter lari subsp. concheus]